MTMTKKERKKDDDISQVLNKGLLQCNTAPEAKSTAKLPKPWDDFDWGLGAQGSSKARSHRKFRTGSDGHAARGAAQERNKPVRSRVELEGSLDLGLDTVCAPRTLQGRQEKKKKEEQSF